MSVLAVLAIAASDASDFSLKLLFTGELRGAMYPVDKRQNECSAGRYNETPCECFGGAARRHAAFAAARDSPDSPESVVLLETGSSFSGAGDFYPAFRGNATARYIAAAGYSAFGLAWRDLGRAPTGELAAFIERMRTLDPAMPAAVLSNLDPAKLGPASTLVPAAVTSRETRMARGHVAPFALVPITGNRTLAVLQFANWMHLVPGRSRTLTSALAAHARGPHGQCFGAQADYARALLPYDQAMPRALENLRRLPGGPPDVIVAVIGGYDLDTEPCVEEPPSVCTLQGSGSSLTEPERLVQQAGGLGAAREAKALELVRRSAGIHVVLFTDVPWGGSHSVDEVITVENYVGETVLVFFEADGSDEDATARPLKLGRAYGEIVVDMGRREAVPVVLNHSFVTRSMDCTAPEDPDVRAQLESDKVAAETHPSLSQIRGTLAAPFEAPLGTVYPLPEGQPKGGCVKLPRADPNVLFCSCRVAQCPQGALIADAWAEAAEADVAVINGGAIRGNFSAVDVTMKHIHSVVRGRESNPG